MDKPPAAPTKSLLAMSLLFATACFKVAMNRFAHGPALLLLVILFRPASITTELRVQNPLRPGLAAGPADADQMIRSAGSHYVAPSSVSLTCSPACCVLPNVDASAGPKPVDETPVAVNPKNPQDLLAVANDSNCAAALGIYSSIDGGNTWERSCMASTGSGAASVDPNVGYDLQGNVFVGGIASKAIVVQASKDNGKTWSPSYKVVGTLLGYFADKPWLQIDTSPKSPYANSLYVSVTQLSSAGHSFSEISLSHSSDGGQNWKTTLVDTGETFPNIDEMTDMAIGADGTVYLTWLRCAMNGPSGTCAGTPATFELSKSTDGGNTWSAPQAIFTANLAPAVKGNFCGYGCLPNTIEDVDNIPVIAIDNSEGPHKGDLYVAYYSWTGTYMRVFVASSTDGGASWTQVPVAPASETHDQFFPWVNVSKSGIVGISWLDRRDDPSNVKYEAFASFSRNGGKSFGKNINLSAGLSDPANDGYGGRFMGDYTGNTWAGNKTFYVTYTDTTTGVGQDFLGGYRFK